MKKIICLLLIFLSFNCVASTLNSMNKEQIEAAFSNKTFQGLIVDTANSFWVFLDSKGTILGYNPSDKLKKDDGSYSINNDGTLFVTWKHWHNAKKLCINVFDAKNTLLIFDCDGGLHTIFVKDKTKEGNGLQN